MRRFSELRWIGFRVWGLLFLLSFIVSYGFPADKSLTLVNGPVKWRLYIKNRAIAEGRYLFDNGNLWVEESVLNSFFNLKVIPKSVLSTSRRYVNSKPFLLLNNLKEYLKVYIRVQPDVGIIDVYSQRPKREGSLYKRWNTSADSRKAERELKGYRTIRTKYFTIKYKNEVVGKLVESVVDDYYKSIEKHLGFDVDVAPITVVIAPNRNDYLAYGSPEWSSGLALPFQRKIFVDEKDPFLIRRVLPHEITHVLFHNYLGFEHPSIRWLSEGIAMYEELRIGLEQTGFTSSMRGNLYPLISFSTTIIPFSLRDRG